MPSPPATGPYTIVLDGQTVTIFPLPSVPAPRTVEPWANNAVAVETSSFTGQTETQDNPGADATGMMVTYPPLRTAAAAPVLAWLLGMRGQLRATFFAPPEYAGPQGSCLGTPVVDSTTVTNNVAGSYTVVTRGWDASTNGLLQPYDLINIGYRLYRVLEVVDSGSSGEAAFEVFPSLRETIADGTAIVTTNPVGLYRLAQNKRGWSASYDGTTHISFPLLEYR
jgi:hypothetical protein